MMKENNMISRLIIISFLLLNTINYPSCAMASRIFSIIITKDVLTELCSRSPNPSLCYDLLKTHIGLNRTGTTASTLASKPLDMAESHARGTKKMLQALYKRVTDPKNEVKAKYRACMARYDDAIKYIVGGKHSSHGRSYKALTSQALLAIDRITSCGNEFASKPSKEPLALKNANKKVKDLCGIIVAVCESV